MAEQHQATAVQEQQEKAEVGAKRERAGGEVTEIGDAEQPVRGGGDHGQAALRRSGTARTDASASASSAASAPAS